MKSLIASLLVLVFSPFAVGASASAFVLPEFFSTNNVTELRYREWGALKGPVKTVALEFALRRVEFSLYNSKDLERDGIPAVHDERRFDVGRMGQGDSANARIVEDEAWLAILNDLSAADIGAWQEWYCDPGVCDGALWQLELWSGANLVKRSGGSNDAPVLYRKLLAAFNRIGGSVGTVKFGIRTLYDDVREKAEKESDPEKRQKMLELLETIEKDKEERKAKYEAETEARRRQMATPDCEEDTCDNGVWKDETTGMMWRYDEISGDEGEKIVELGVRRPAVVGKDASRLEKIALPGKVNGMRVYMVGSRVFEGCTNLVYVSIPAEVCGVDSSAFASLRKLERIDVHEYNENYKSSGGALYSKDGSSLVAWPRASKSFCVTVPGDVRRIVPDAFAGCGGIVALTIPASVTNFCQRSFAGCRNLSGVALEGGVPAWLSSDSESWLPKGCVIYADGAPSEVAYRRTKPIAEARVRVVSLVPSVLRGVPDKVGRFTVERRALLARDEYGAGYAFSEWDVETVASANVFVFSGLASEKALFEAARKRNRALWPQILHPGQSELCYNLGR